MKRKAGTVLLVFFVFCFVFYASLMFYPPKHNVVEVTIPPPMLSLEKLKEKQHRAMHFIVIVNDDEKASCTAYAVAPHVLLTADHCMAGDSRLYIDQPRSALRHVAIFSNVLYDHQDHVLVVFPKETFKDYVEYNPLTYRPPVQGEHVYTWGNPKAIPDQYREGYVIGRKPDENKEFDVLQYMLVMPVAGGDSGALIFSAEDGRVVSVVTYGWPGGVAGGYALGFTPEQVNSAKNGLGGCLSDYNYYPHNAPSDLMKR